jgi:hypothetical protein
MASQLLISDGAPTDTPQVPLLLRRQPRAEDSADGVCFTPP